MNQEKKNPFLHIKKTGTISRNGVRGEIIALKSGGLIEIRADGLSVFSNDIKRQSPIAVVQYESMPVPAFAMLDKSYFVATSSSNIDHDFDVVILHNGFNVVVDENIVIISSSPHNGKDKLMVPGAALITVTHREVLPLEEKSVILRPGLIVPAQP